MLLVATAILASSGCGRKKVNHKILSKRSQEEATASVRKRSQLATSVASRQSPVTPNLAGDRRRVAGGVAGSHRASRALCYSNNKQAGKRPASGRKRLQPWQAIASNPKGSQDAVCLVGGGGYGAQSFPPPVLCPILSYPMISYPLLSAL